MACSQCEGHQSVYHATVIQRLKKAGAILLGRTNGSVWDGIVHRNSHFGPTKNPWDLTRIQVVQRWLGSGGGCRFARLDLIQVVLFANLLLCVEPLDLNRRTGVFRVMG